MTSTSSDRGADGGWSVRATRETGGLSATAEAVVRDQSSADSAEWQALAGTKAWLSLAETFLATGRPEDASAAAQSGIEELGGLYRAKLGKDDTRLKLLAAEDRRAQGAAAQAAEMTVRVLRERVAAFLRNHDSVQS